MRLHWWLILLHLTTAQGEPLLWLEFDDISKADFVYGAVAFDQPGPQPPRYPGFQESNQAVQLSERGSYFGWHSRPEYQFTNGEAITLEAWVALDMIGRHENVYVIGKGRTKAGKKNQNYALRLREKGGHACPSFLFSTAGGAFHRWTADHGFAPGRDWHHVAVAYEFGKPDSIAAWVDGVQSKGSWDLGGPTSESPVVDDDALWIGSSMGGNTGNSFKGRMDSIGLHKEILSGDFIKNRFAVRVEPLAIPVTPMPRDAVRIDLFENFEADQAWPRLMEMELTESYREEAFGFFRYPQRYISTGVRADRSNPLLLRASANIALEKGRYQLLLRSRGAARLWMDGELIASTPFPRRYIDGHDPVPEFPDEISPWLPVLAPGHRQAHEGIVSSGGTHLFIMETLVGGKKLRSELGATTVSLSKDGKHFTLLAPVREIAHTSAGWEQHLEERTRFYKERDREKRRAIQRARHGEREVELQVLREWLASESKVTLPSSGEHPIDSFIEKAVRVSNVTANASEEETMGIETWAILKERCFKCHNEKAKGGLRLDEPEAFLAGGDSGAALVVPGKPGESLLYQLVTSAEEDDRMPPKGARLTDVEQATIRKWIEDGGAWSGGAKRSGVVTIANSVDDLTFLRRLALDTVGTVPTPEEIANFLADPPDGRREQAIDRYLQDDRWADHWVSYWQDVLAENPSILKPALNNTGPFRWWIHEALLDNKPMDQFARELIRMEGSAFGGGPAGFGLASQNDVPMAAKAHVIGTAFLGVEMKCARCHDAPYHSSRQADLFSMAAMLARKPVVVPKSSSVPQASLEGRKALIQVTLKPGSEVKPDWPFPSMHQHPGGSFGDDTGEQLAFMVAGPGNWRFAEVMVNRLWKQLLGRGIVEPVDDWEHGVNSHPQLLRYLAQEFVQSGYDFKALARLIFTSQTYQREVSAAASGEALDLFAVGRRRKLSSEQIVDSLFQISGKPLGAEQLCMDPDGGRDAKTMLNLGHPTRAWEFVSLSNERDRPALAMPRAQSVVDVLSVFGWRNSRPNPLTEREELPNVLQPALLANGAMTRRITGLSDDSALTALCLQPHASAESLTEALFQRILTRPPTSGERREFADWLRAGFESRVIETANVSTDPESRHRHVSWSNHLSPEATLIKQAQERETREGDPPTVRLEADWRERAEDVVWALINTPEMIFVP